MRRLVVASRKLYAQMTQSSNGLSARTDGDCLAASEFREQFLQGGDDFQVGGKFIFVLFLKPRKGPSPGHLLAGGCALKIGSFTNTANACSTGAGVGDLVLGGGVADGENSGAVGAGTDGEGADWGIGTADVGALSGGSSAMCRVVGGCATGAFAGIGAGGGAICGFGDSDGAGGVSGVRVGGGGGWSKSASGLVFFGGGSACVARIADSGWGGFCSIGCGAGAGTGTDGVVLCGNVAGCSCIPAGGGGGSACVVSIAGGACGGFCSISCGAGAGGGTDGVAFCSSVAGCGCISRGGGGGSEYVASIAGGGGGFCSTGDGTGAGAGTDGVAFCDNVAGRGCISGGGGGGSVCVVSTAGGGGFCSIGGGGAGAGGGAEVAVLGGGSVPGRRCTPGGGGSGGVGAVLTVLAGFVISRAALSPACGAGVRGGGIDCTGACGAGGGVGTSGLGVSRGFKTKGSSHVGQGTVWPVPSAGYSTD